VSIAGLQARALLDSGASERSVAEVVARDLGRDVDALLAEPYHADPLRAHDVAPVTDGAAAVVLAAGDRARQLTDRPVWITGIDHRIEPPALGVRDLTRSPSTERAAAGAGVAAGPVDVAELYTAFAHEELILRPALGLAADTVVNPSGGVLRGNCPMATGLMRVGEAARALAGGRGARGVAHATSGPCLQQNLVCVLEVGR